MTSNELAIIVPVFNEEKTINLILKRIKNQGDVILIDDYSTDNSILGGSQKVAYLTMNGSTPFTYSAS